jgi:hypothetical protein
MRHQRYSVRVLIFAAAALVSVCISTAGIAQNDQPLTANQTRDFSKEEIRFFNVQVRPILAKHCLECHGNKLEDLGGGLAMISHKSMMTGGDSGPAVDLKKPLASVFVDAINYGDYEMPPSGKLPAEQRAILTKWIEMGLPWDPKDAGKVVELPKNDVPQVNEQSKAFWSFQPVKAPEVPRSFDSTWPRNDIDQFILAKLKAGNLEPAEPTARRDLIRRAFYDLTGLPPTLEEVTAFVSDNSPDAYAKLIDRLLASPHYGEKWGRHWLDLVRYAESNSFERDGAKPFVWRYRDYVIRSFNADKPYDQFLIEQLAGDELPTPTNDSIIATGYYRLGQWDDEPADPKQAMYDDLDDILATTSQSMMGLTVNCARCHDHKIDPIPQKDYYQMLAFFRNIKRYGVRAHETVLDNSTRNIEKETPPDQAELTAYADRLEKQKKQIQNVLDIVVKDFESVEHDEFAFPENHDRLVRKRVDSKVISKKQLDSYLKAKRSLAKLEANPPHVQRVLCVNEIGSDAAKTHILIRGNSAVEGTEVQPGFISVLSPPAPFIQPQPNNHSTGRRLALARWIANPNHPLTARVMVNRIWQHHFGRGIVRSPNDFGFQGNKPTHPKLLDHLAAKFVDSGWSIKQLHRKIMLSATYQMSNRFDQAAYDKDPLNDLFWRFDMRRLTAEEIRDSILAVNGRLNRKKMFGPSVYTQLSQEVLAGQSMPGAGWGKSREVDQLRRSIYIHAKRSLKVPLLANFDVADTDATCPVRFNTTQPTQALGLLNSEFSNHEAMKLVDLVTKQHSTLRQRVIAINQRVIQGEPNSDDIVEGLGLIAAWQTEDGLDENEALAFYCLLALNSNEFIYLK